MTTLLFTHPVFLQHDTGPGHPERPERLQAVLDALSTPEFAVLERRDAAPASRDALSRVHDRGYVDATLDAIPSQGRRALDSDTVISPASGEAALRAAGAVCQAVDALAGDEARRAFCAVRPPGHHAEPDRAMGFCLFNNVAVGAAHARHAHGMQRVAVVDFDVHHGNGTQTMLSPRTGYLYASIHQGQFYPGTGHRDENQPGSLINVPLPAGTDSATFRSAFEQEIVDAVIDFQPELVFISAGFDAHARDPLAGLRLGAEDFRWATEALVAVAEDFCGGRTVSVLEGGYDLEALAECTAAHVRALL